MKFLVDASVAAKWLFDELDSSTARSLLSQRNELFAPDLILLELANVVWKKRIQSEILSVTAEIQWLNELPNVVELLKSADFVGEATRLAVELSHPIYDCIYLASAASVSIPLVTVDRKLSERASNTLLDVDVIDLSTAITDH